MRLYGAHERQSCRQKEASQMSYQAIVTRYHGPGNVKGSRVKATAQAGSTITEWDDDARRRAQSCGL